MDRIGLSLKRKKMLTTQGRRNLDFFRGENRGILGFEIDFLRDCFSIPSGFFFHLLLLLRPPTVLREKPLLLSSKGFSLLLSFFHLRRVILMEKGGGEGPFPFSSSSSSSLVPATPSPCTTRRPVWDSQIKRKKL